MRLIKKMTMLVPWYVRNTT